MAEMLGRVQASITVLLQELLKIVLANIIQLTRMESLSRQLVGLSCDRSMQAEHFTGLGQAHDKSLPIAAGHREFDLTLADQVHTPRSLTFDKDDCTFGKNGGMLDLLP